MYLKVDFSTSRIIYIHTPNGGYWKEVKSYLNPISSLFPRACAYFISVARLGIYVLFKLSSLEILDFEVPIFLAISSCVSPFAMRVAINSFWVKTSLEAPF